MTHKEDKFSLTNDQNHQHDANKSDSCCGDCQGGPSCTKIKGGFNLEILKEIASS